MNSQFVMGVAVGIAGIYVYHHFVRPLPGAKS